MADSGGADVGGICGLIIFSALNPWCNTHAFGANGCCNSNSTAGCCGSCCNKSFDEDRFDEQMEEDSKKSKTNKDQPPIPTEGMSVPVQPAT